MTVTVHPLPARSALTMALPAPNLDDRRFQDLVDDAKRLVQQRCPEWTDHNVSDPGVTLIEPFAWMTDQLLYRLNRVPDRHYVKFLELLGVASSRRSRPGRRSRSGSRAPARRGPDRRRDPGRDRPHAGRRGDRLRDHRRPGDRPLRPRPGRARSSTARQFRDRIRRASTRAPGFLLLRHAAQAGRRPDGRPDRRRPVVRGHASGSRPRSRASASIPTGPPLVWEAWDGARLESPARSTATRPAA